MRKSKPQALFAALVLALALVPILGPSAAAAPAVDPSSLLTWAQLAPASAPPARVHPAIAFDSGSKTTVLFGGRSGSDVLADTWTWDGTTWTAQNPPASPPPLESASMAYDGHQIVLFGGVGRDGRASDGTWAWTGATWAPLAPALVPRARYGASLVADAANNTAVLFGGLSAPGVSLGDTWSWNGASWAQENPASNPTPRSSAAMTFDPSRGVVVLFGGIAGSENRADTWTWDGTNWSEHNLAVSPPARSDAAFAFDAGSLTAVLFAGSGNGASPFRDTWLWNGSTWSVSLPLTAAPILSPPARTGAVMAGAREPQRLVLFGGQLSGSGGPDNDTWTVATVVPTPHTPPTTVAGTGSATTLPTVTTAAPTTAKGPSTTAVPITSPSPGSSRSDGLAVKTGQVAQGGSVQVSGSGFVPGATITITLHTVPVVVGTTTADSHGVFRYTVQVPPNAPIGEHPIEAAGPAKVGGRAVLVARVHITPPGRKQSWLLPALMVALTVLLAAGAGIVLTASARWRHHRPA